MRHVGRLVGWFLTYFYGLGIVALPMANCTQGSDDPWTLTLFLEVPLLVVGLALIWLGRPWHLADRLLGVPHLLTLTLGPFVVTPFLISSTLGGQHVCHAHLGYFADLRPAWWHPAWAPVEVLCLATLGFTIFSTWRQWHQSLLRRAA
jgi:hypothetical protein